MTAFFADRFPKKNILTPIGWTAIAVMTICTAGAVQTWPSSLSWVLVGVAIVPLAVCLWAYIYFAISDPDRLQTEDYRIQKEFVARIGNNVSGKEITINNDGRPLIRDTLDSPNDRGGAK